MHTLTAPETTVASLHELDELLHSLWAHEPDCRFTERHHLLNTLRQLSIEVEQLAFRQSFHCDEPLDQDRLAELTQRTSQLAANWSKDLWMDAPWPSALLGERAHSGSI